MLAASSLSSALLSKLIAGLDGMGSMLWPLLAKTPVGAIFLLDGPRPDDELVGSILPRTEDEPPLPGGIKGDRESDCDGDLGGAFVLDAAVTVRDGCAGGCKGNIELVSPPEPEPLTADG